MWPVAGDVLFAAGGELVLTKAQRSSDRNAGQEPRRWSELCSKVALAKMSLMRYIRSKSCCVMRRGRSSQAAGDPAAPAGAVAGSPSTHCWQHRGRSRSALRRRQDCSRCVQSTLSPASLPYLGDLLCRWGSFKQ